MKKLFVNNIIEQYGTIIGIAVFNKTVIENLENIYAPTHLNNLKRIMRDNKDGCYWIDRYCQYIILVRSQPGVGLSMTISDYGNDLDTALDEYSRLKVKDWNREDREKIMRLFQEIQDSQPEKAEMIIKDPIS